MNNQHHQQTGSGLTRFRSAPSSYFADLLNSNDDCGVGFGVGVGVDAEADDEFEQLFNPPETNKIFSIQEHNNYPSQFNSQFYEPEKLLRKQSSNDYSSSSQFMYPASIDIKIEGGGGGGTSSLIRQSSSPAGLFANINSEKEFGTIKGMGFSSRHMATISEIGSKETRENSPGDNVQFNEAMTSWDDSYILPDHQNNEGGKRPATILSHHLSLPKSTTTEFSSMENLLKDSVPWKIRAKRGFATHPRSIAERVRRTKISERMRKLQELVPNMDKQTNTADMLDLAVDYIKDLQTQVKKLADNRAKCSCLAKGKS